MDRTDGAVPTAISEADTEPIAISALAAATISVARRELALGVRETSRNRGERIDVYHREGGGVDPELLYPWCASFASFCVLEALKETPGPWTFERGASCYKLKIRNPDRWQRTPTVGGIWLRIDSGGKGHCGIVVSVNAGKMQTIEGNTGTQRVSAHQDREGDGVYARVRDAAEATGGFILL